MSRKLQFSIRLTALSVFKNAFNTFFDDVDGIAELIKSGKPDTLEKQILYIAERLASGKPPPSQTDITVPLAAISSTVEFRTKREKTKYYRADTLKVEKDVLFPSDISSGSDDISLTFWERFVTKTSQLKKYRASDFNTLYYILKEMGSLIPYEPDVPLFIHSKITCALAACLVHHDQNSLTDTDAAVLAEALKHDQLQHDQISNQLVHQHLFILLRADIAGIQKFIYSVTKPEGETRGTSRRLRGRSFYLSLLPEVISDWIIRQCDLPTANVLFCGGGRFDIILPQGISKGIDDLRKTLSHWLLKTFYGELSIQMVTVPVKPADFFNYAEIHKKAEDELLKVKAVKYSDVFDKDDFFVKSEEKITLCTSCLLTPLEKGDLCDSCNNHTRIGAALPKKKYMAFVYETHEQQKSFGLAVPFDKFNVTVYLQDETERQRLVQQGLSAMIYAINPKFKETNGLDFIPQFRNKPSAAFGFKFMGNAAPVATRSCQIIPPPFEKAHTDETLEFEEIAALSKGAEYLGVLKMDVDYLGMIFSLGITPPSIARTSALSANMETFFTAWLNRVCFKITEEWNNSLPDDHPHKNVVESLFYIVYSGGDDLFIIGPWDKTIELACAVNSDFRQYTAYNPNLTLSGGILFVQPHFPVHRFAHLVGKELDKSKRDDDLKDTDNASAIKYKNRLTLFDVTVPWKNEYTGFDKILEFAKSMANAVERTENPLPKGFVYFLGRLEKGAAQHDSMWAPHFFYSLARRVSDEELQSELIKHVPLLMETKTMKIPVSYVSLITRKE